LTTHCYSVCHPNSRLPALQPFSTLPCTPVVGTITTFLQDPHQVSANRHTVYDTIDLIAAPEDAHRLLPTIRAKLHSDVLEVDLTGSPAFYSDVESVSESDLRRAEILTFPIALAALALVFGSVVAGAGPRPLARVAGAA